MTAKKKNAQNENEMVLNEQPDYYQALSPNFVNFYANNVEIGVSVWDMRFIFGEIMGVKDKQLLVEKRARIVMSLQHAKVFAALLAQQIEKLEQRFGEIQLLTEKATNLSDQQASQLPKPREP